MDTQDARLSMADRPVPPSAPAYPPSGINCRSRSLT